jgi:ribonuclease Z
MAELIVLGSASAIPNEDHENTHLALRGDQCHVLIDCVGNPLVRLKKAKIDLEKLNDIILTHCHPDHISGIPSFLMSLWLMGRRKSLHIYGLHHTLDCVEKMMGLYEWEKWPDFFSIAFHRLPADQMRLILENDEFRIYSSPVQHMVPTIGLRIESPKTGTVIAYSCDTEPCEQVVKLANGADVLFHESTGESYGHSSAFQAGEVAQKAGAKALYLIHYSPEEFRSKELICNAQTNFHGEVKFAEDFMELSF